MYEKYDRYDAINIDKCSDIPWEYDGLMGVPITLLGNHKYDGLYELVDILKDHKTSINGVNKYARLIIRSKLPNGCILLDPTIGGVPLSERNK